MFDRSVKVISSSNSVVFDMELTPVSSKRNQVSVNIDVSMLVMLSIYSAVLLVLAICSTKQYLICKTDND